MGYCDGSLLVLDYRVARVSRQHTRPGEVGLGVGEHTEGRARKQRGGDRSRPGVQVPPGGW